MHPAPCRPCTPWPALFLLFSSACAAPSGDPEADPKTSPVRLGMVAPPRAFVEYETHPTPLVYGGGFLNKMLVFETLVRLDREGRALPGLARSWSASADARTWTFELRPDARFHSGAACDAAAVREHMLRWLGGSVDQFLPAATGIEAVEATGPHTLVFRLKEPRDLPADLAIVNPFAVVGPGAARGEERPVLDGTGAWKITAYEPMRRFRFEPHAEHDGPRPSLDALELLLYPAASPRDAIGVWALRRGHVDALLEDWMPKIPRSAALRLAKDERFVLERVPGSAVRLLTFNAARAPFSDVGWRQRVAAAVDRERLIQEVEAGLAKPTRALFAPPLAGWPQDVAETPPASATSGRVKAQLLVSESSPEDLRAALLLRADLAEVDVDLELAIVDGAESDRRLWAGEFDLALAWTWGVPYDPRATLHSRFLPQPEKRTAVETPPYFTSPELSARIHEFLRATRPEESARLAASIQQLITIEAAVVPLYVPERIALRRRELTGLDLRVPVYDIGVAELALADGR